MYQMNLTRTITKNFCIKYLHSSIKGNNGIIILITRETTFIRTIFEDEIIYRIIINTVQNRYTSERAPG